MKTAFLGLGTNIGNKTENLKEAVEALKHLPKTQVEAVSEYYETEPVGYTQQDNFLNTCVKLKTDLSPGALLGCCFGIEASFGRERPFKNSPRTLDIDLLLYEDCIKDTEELTLPHKEMKNRGFVLVPLKDILPELKFCGIDFSEAYSKCEKSGVKKFL